MIKTSCNTPITDTTTIGSNTFVLCHDDVICLSFETVGEGNLIITDGTVTTDRIYEAMNEDLTIIIFSNKMYIPVGGTVIHWDSLKNMILG